VLLVHVEVLRVDVLAQHRQRALVVRGARALHNAEKAAVRHLVSANASAVCHGGAPPVLRRSSTAPEPGRAAGDDDAHAAMGVALLRDEAPRTYARLREVVAEAWDMIGAMTDRLAELTRADDWMRAFERSQDAAAE